MMSLLEPDYRRPAVYGEGIRIASPRDADRIAALLTQLGYPHDREQGSAQLLTWAAEPQGEVLVAEADGAAVGFAAVHRIPYFERPGAFARVVALSVDAGYRRAGTGGASWTPSAMGRSARCVDVEVTSLRSRRRPPVLRRAGLRGPVRGVRTVQAALAPGPGA